MLLGRTFTAQLSLIPQRTSPEACAVLGEVTLLHPIEGDVCKSALSFATESPGVDFPELRLMTQISETALLAGRKVYISETGYKQNA